MVRRLLLTAVAVVFALSVAVAADAISIQLSDFKAKPTFAGSDELAGYDDGESRVFLYTNGTATAEVKIPEDGEYTIVFDAGCTVAEKEFAKVKISVGDVVANEKFELTEEDRKEYKVSAKLKKGTTKLTFEFLNDKYKENEYDLNFFLYKASIVKK